MSTVKMVDLLSHPNCNSKVGSIAIVALPKVKEMKEKHWSAATLLACGCSANRI